MLSPWPPTTEIKASIFSAFSRFNNSSDMSTSSTISSALTVADMKRIHPARLAEDTPAGRIQVLNQLRAEGHQSALGVAFRVQQPVKPIPDADHLPSQFARRQGRSHHTAFIPGTKPAPTMMAMRLRKLP